MPNLDTGNTSFMLLCSSLVMLMTPGLAFFYGGLVSRRNVLAIMMQSFVSMGWTTLIWFVCGYSLCFSGDFHGIIGNLDMAFLRGVTLADKPGMSARDAMNLAMLTLDARLAWAAGDHDQSILLWRRAVASTVAAELALPTVAVDADVPHAKVSLDHVFGADSFTGHVAIESDLRFPRLREKLPPTARGESRGPVRRADSLDGP